MNKIKLSRNELIEITKRSIDKVLKEDFNNSTYPEDIEFDSNNDSNTDMENVSIDTVLNSYLETLIWSSGEEFDGYSIADIDENSINRSREDIWKFIDMVKKDTEAIDEMNSYDESDFGHNLALSRNGHGAGFFDDNNDILQELARNLGVADLYIGDDNKLYIMGAERNENKLRLTKNELTEIVKRTITKVLKEDWQDSFTNMQDNISQASDVDIIDESEEFIPNGTYTVSNTGGYEVMISDDGEMAKVRDAFGSDNPETSDWLPIEYVEYEDDDDYPEVIAVIDPEGYNIPLNQVMRIRESKKPKTIRIKLSELKEIITNAVREDNSPSSGLSDAEKSNISKKAHTGKDIGKPGKNFKKVAAKAAKEYGSEETGERVAAAAMWKNAGK